MYRLRDNMKKIYFVVIATVFSLLIISDISAQETGLSGDLNNDGVVNILDLSIVASHFGKSIVPEQDPNPDVNGDGVVSILDLVLVASMFGDKSSDKTVIFGRGGDSITLDPALVLDGESAKVCDMIYDTLVQYREGTTDIEPSLAKMWDTTADGLTWTFYLREGVTFHDGTPFNAHIAAFSLNRPKAQTDSFFNQIITHIIALDEYTLEIQLNTPYAPFLSTIASTENSIVSQSAVMHYGDDFGNNPVGTGPFKFIQWDRNDQIVLQASDTHWGGKPEVDKFIFRSIPDNSVRFMELQAGHIHAMEFPNPEDLVLVHSDRTLELVMQPSLNIGYLAMNMDKPPFGNLKVRLAINHAFNKADIIHKLYQGTGIPAKNPIPPSLWSYDDTIEDYPYDPEYAKQLLAEAGYPDGFETTLWALPIPRPYIPNGIALAEVLQSELRNIGIEATIVTHDWPTYIDKVTFGEHDMAMLGWSASADPDNFLYYLLSKTTAEKPALNIAFYRSDEMQDVLDRARMSNDRDERIELYKQAQAIFHRDVPWVPLAHANRILVINNKVQNLKLAPAGWKYLRSVSLNSD